MPRPWLQSLLLLALCAAVSVWAEDDQRGPVDDEYEVPPNMRMDDEYEVPPVDVEYAGGDEMVDEQEPMPPEDESVEDIMAELQREQEEREVAAEAAREAEREARDQQKRARQEAKQAADEAKLGEVIVAVDNPRSADNAHEISDHTAKLFQGDDAAAASFRFCEKAEILEKEWLLAVAAQLNTALSEQKPNYRPAASAVLKSAGAYSKRAKVHSKDGEYDLAAIDLIRALSRRGLEEDVVAKMERALNEAFRGLRGQRQAERKEMAKAEKLAKQKRKAEQAMVEARARKELDVEDWVKFAADTTAAAMAQAASATAADKQPVATITLTVTKHKNGDEVGQQEEQVKVMEGHDEHVGAFEFCAAKGLADAQQLTEISAMLRKKMDESEYEVPTKPGGDDAGALLKAAKQAQKEGKRQEAGADYSRVLALESATDDQKAEATELVSNMIELLKKMEPVDAAFKAGEYAQALQLATEIRQDKRNSDARLWLIVAHCHQQLGQHSDAYRAAARVLEMGASYGSWKRGEPRMMAINLGAGVAMELGNFEKALKFYKTALKYDPDQKEIRKQVRCECVLQSNSLRRTASTYLPAALRPLLVATERRLVWL